MTYPCPQCGHPLVKEGSWFKTASNYMCASCGTAVQMTYAAKLRLFAMYDRQQTKPT
jgi:transposase-like protein